MGIRTWAAAAAVAACAWAGNAQAVVYNLDVDLTYIALPTAHPLGSAVAFANFPAVHLLVGDTLIIHASYDSIPSPVASRSEPGAYLGLSFVGSTAPFPDIDQVHLLAHYPEGPLFPAGPTQVVYPWSVKLGPTGFTLSVSYVSLIAGYADAGISIDGVSAFSPPIPEPSTWVMMLIGFAGLGFVALRKSMGADRDTLGRHNSQTA